MKRKSAAPARNNLEYDTTTPVGEVLRRARMQKNKTIDEVESELHIKSSQLEVIEGGEYEKLPGRVYAIGFIRSYAEYLDLDGGQIVHMFKTQSIAKTPEPDLHFPEVPEEARLPSFGLILGSLIVCSGLVSIWFWQNSNYSEVFSNIPDVPKYIQERFEKLNAGLGAEPVSRSSVEQAVPEPDIVQVLQQQQEGNEPAPLAQDQQPEPANMALASEPGIQVPGVTFESNIANQPQILAPRQTREEAIQEQAESASVVTPQPEPKKSPQRDGVVLRITEESWVQIQDASGRSIVSRVLKEGDQYFVPNRPDLLMSVGNAGGVMIVIDGEEIAPLGPRGAVRTEVTLDKQALKESLGVNTQNSLEFNR